MHQKLHPGVVAALLSLAAIVIAVFAWRTFAPPAPENTGAGKLQRSTVTRNSDGSLQFSSEARTQRGPRSFPNAGVGSPGPR